MTAARAHLHPLFQGIAPAEPSPYVLRPRLSEAEALAARAAKLQSAEVFYDLIPDHVWTELRGIDHTRPARPQSELLFLEMERLEAAMTHARAMFADDNRTRKIMARQGNTDGAKYRRACCQSRWTSYREFRAQLITAKTRRFTARMSELSQAAE